jgi:hypothetical protein
MSGAIVKLPVRFYNRDFIEQNGFIRHHHGDGISIESGDIPLTPE